MWPCSASRLCHGLRLTVLPAISVTVSSLPRAFHGRRGLFVPPGTGEGAALLHTAFHTPSLHFFHRDRDSALSPACGRAPGLGSSAWLCYCRRGWQDTLLKPGFPLQEAELRACLPDPCGLGLALSPSPHLSWEYTVTRPEAGLSDPEGSLQQAAPCIEALTFSTFSLDSCHGVGLRVADTERPAGLG